MHWAGSKSSEETHPQVLERHRELDTHPESSSWLYPRTMWKENVLKSVKTRTEVGWCDHGDHLEILPAGRCGGRKASPAEEGAVQVVGWV